MSYIVFLNNGSHSSQLSVDLAVLIEHVLLCHIFI